VEELLWGGTGGIKKNQRNAMVMMVEKIVVTILLDLGLVFILVAGCGVLGEMRPTGG
jgi:hypothetical protein